MADVAQAVEIAAPDNEPVATFKKRSIKPKATLRKRLATPPAASGSESDHSSDDDAGQRVGKRRKTGLIAASSNIKPPIAEDLTASTFTADRSGTIQPANDATKQSNWYDESATDALSERNLLGKTRPISAASAGAGARNGSYKGAAGYQSFIPKNPNAPSRQVGPVKAPTNIRTITVTDFAPDVCKDYKQTGFCGFGDSCKFLHAREDYKQGWELDRDWEIGTKGKKIGGRTVASANRVAKTGDESDEEDSALLENIPFACIVCKKSYSHPVVTKCGHYFCEACALGRYKKDPSCAACGAGTGGIFNVAKNLTKLLDRKRERAKKRKEKAVAEGAEVSSDEEE